jgi:hypothetical protein
MVARGLLILPGMVPPESQFVFALCLALSRSSWLVALPEKCFSGRFNLSGFGVNRELDVIVRSRYPDCLFYPGLQYWHTWVNLSPTFGQSHTIAPWFDRDSPALPFNCLSF